MVKLSSMRADIAAERDGVWVDLGGGFEMRIASTGGAEYQKARDKAFDPYRELFRSGKADQDIVDRVVREVASEHIIRDWRGLEDDDGKPIAYSPKEALELISDPRMHALWEKIQGIANQETRFRESETKKALGN